MYAFNGTIILRRASKALNKVMIMKQNRAKCWWLALQGTLCLHKLEMEKRGGPGFQAPVTSWMDDSKAPRHLSDAQPKASFEGKTLFSERTAEPRRVASFPAVQTNDPIDVGWNSLDLLPGPEQPRRTPPSSELSLGVGEALLPLDVSLCSNELHFFLFPEPDPPAH